MKKKVIDLANKLNYTPNSLALSLKDNRTFVIGVIIPKLVHYFFSTVVAGVEDEAYKRGYRVIITQSNESYSREATNVNALISSKVDGILASLSKETIDYDHLRKAQRQGIPLVLFDRVTNEIDSHQVSVNDRDGAYQGVKHLIDIGCKRIAFFGGPDTLTISKDRRQGYIDALTDHGMEVVPELISLADDNEKGHQEAVRLWSSKNFFDGLFTINDLTAVGAISALKEMGVKIPKDVAVCGYSGGPLASYSDPQLTTIHQPGFEMGQEAARLLIDDIENKEELPHRHITLKTKLTMRPSTIWKNREEKVS
jgi:LacI family transcriptional regulator